MFKASGQDCKRDFFKPTLNIEGYFKSDKSSVQDEEVKKLMEVEKPTNEEKDIDKEPKRAILPLTLDMEQLRLSSLESGSWYPASSHDTNHDPFKIQIELDHDEKMVDKDNEIRRLEWVIEEQHIVL